MSEPLDLQEITIIADNDHGWAFGVGRLGARWVGFACESAHARAVRQAFAGEGLPTEPGLICFFTEVATGYDMGVPDRDRAVLLTGAVARDPQSAYGGAQRWYVDERLRGDPENCRCAKCERIGCDGSICEDLEYVREYP